MLGHISPIFARFFAVFSLFSPSRRQDSRKWRQKTGGRFRNGPKRPPKDWSPPFFRGVSRTSLVRQPGLRRRRRGAGRRPRPRCGRCGTRQAGAGRTSPRRRTYTDSAQSNATEPDETESGRQGIGVCAQVPALGAAVAGHYRVDVVAPVVVADGDRAPLHVHGDHRPVRVGPVPLPQPVREELPVDPWLAPFLHTS